MSRASLRRLSRSPDIGEPDVAPTVAAADERIDPPV